mgnify:CR=1 FL=1
MLPPFVFDFTLGRSNVTYTNVPPVHTPLVTEPKHLCPYPIPKIEEILKDIERAARSTDKHKFVSDLMECGAIAISNLVDLPQREKREKRYLQIMKSYAKENQKSLADIFAKIFALLSSVVYDDGRFDDYLGKLFMNSDLGNEHTGQFFTPYHISRFMAEVTLTEELITEKADRDEIITISDPCCGGGGMLVAALEVLKCHGVNYARNCYLDAADIDLRCVHMTHLQLSLTLAALAGAETSTRLHNQSNPSTNQGSRKRFAKQRFFGKRSRNRTKRAGCLGKLPEKRGLRRRRRGGQGAPLTRLRCPVVPAARKLVFMPSLAFNFRGRHPSSWQYAPYLSAHSGTEEQ